MVTLNAWRPVDGVLRRFGQPDRLPTLAPELDRCGDPYGWLAGDNASSVTLPDGSDLWFMADSFLGVADVWGKADRLSMVNNVLLRVDRRTGDVRSLIGANNALPQAMSDLTGTPISAYWTGEGVDLGYVDTAPAGYLGRGLTLTLPGNGTGRLVGALCNIAEPDGSPATQSTIKVGLTAPVGRTIRVGMECFGPGGVWPVRLGEAWAPTRTVSAATGTVSWNDLVNLPDGTTMYRPIYEVVASTGTATPSAVTLTRPGALPGDRRWQSWQSSEWLRTVDAVIRPEALPGWVKPSAFSIRDCRIWLYESWRRGGKVWCAGSVITPTGQAGVDPAWDFVFSGTSVIVGWDEQTLTLTDAVAIPSGPIELGSAAIVSGDVLYLFGTREHKQCLAATPADNPGSTVLYWTGSTWGTDPTAAAYLIPEQIGSVLHAGGRWRAMFIPAFGDTLRSYSAASLTGPWTLDPEIHDVLEDVTTDDGGVVYGYIARDHPQCDPNADWVAISYCRNVVSGPWDADILTRRPSVTAVTTLGRRTTPPVQAPPSQWAVSASSAQTGGTTQPDAGLWLNDGSPVAVDGTPTVQTGGTAPQSGWHLNDGSAAATSPFTVQVGQQPADGWVITT